MTERVKYHLEHWVCAWCFRWNGPKDVSCHRCGRDIEYPKWSRVGKSKRGSDADIPT